MSKVKEAVDKLVAEINGEKNTYIEYVGEQILDILQSSNSEEMAEKILVEGKTLKGSYKAMHNEAKTIAVNGMAVITPTEGFKIIGKYYGIDLEKVKMENACENKKSDVLEVEFKRDSKEIDVDLDDLF